jgi:hypothetical protein
MLRADGRKAIPVFAALGFNEGSYAGLERHDLKKAPRFGEA